jgi:steroid delta-isomerase-like uncharacterized protein
MDRRLLLSGAALAATMLANPAQADDAGALAYRFAATLSAHDMAAFAALFAEDYVNHQTSAATPPPPPGRTQKQLSVGFFAARLASIPDLQVGVETVVASADKVAASFVYSGTHGGMYLGVAPTGRPLRFTSCDIFRVRDGQLVEHWGMGDLAGTLAQMGS